MWCPNQSLMSSLPACIAIDALSETGTFIGVGVAGVFILLSVLTLMGIGSSGGEEEGDKYAERRLKDGRLSMLQ